MTSRREIRVLLFADGPICEKVHAVLLEDIANKYQIGDSNEIIEVLDMLEEQDIDVILLAEVLESISGFDAYKSIIATGHRLPVIMLATEGNDTVAVKALKLGFKDYMPIPQLTSVGLSRSIKGVMTQTSLIKRLAKATEKQLIAEKQLHQCKIREAELSGIQKMTTTYAHEINNPLTGVLGLIQLLVEKHCDDQDTCSTLFEIRDASLRIRDVIQKIEKLKDPVFKDYLGKTKMVDLSRE